MLRHYKVAAVARPQGTMNRALQLTVMHLAGRGSTGAELSAQIVFECGNNFGGEIADLRVG